METTGTYSVIACIPQNEIFLTDYFVIRSSSILIELFLRKDIGKLINFGEAKSGQGMSLTSSVINFRYRYQAK